MNNKDLAIYVAIECITVILYIIFKESKNVSFAVLFALLFLIITYLNDNNKINIDTNNNLSILIEILKNNTIDNRTNNLINKTVNYKL